MPKAAGCLSRSRRPCRPGDCNPVIGQGHAKRIVMARNADARRCRVRLTTHTFGAMFCICNYWFRIRPVRHFLKLKRL